MNTLLEKPKILRPEELNPTVAKSVAKPDAFTKPGTISHAKVRFRPTNEKRMGRPRKRKRDIRDVLYY